MDNYSTSTLLGVLAGLSRPSSFLLDMWAPSEQTFETEDVKFDKVEKRRKLAPLVSPVVAGKPDTMRGYETKTIAPPYVKPMHPVEPGKTMKRRAGESLNGQKSLVQRRDEMVIDNLRIEDDEITRLETWMLAQILKTGKVTLKGENHPERLVDLVRLPEFTKALAGASRWGETGVSPYQNIVAWARYAAQKVGMHHGHVIMGPGAVELLQADEEFKELTNRRSQNEGEIKFLPQATGADGQEALYLGSTGQFAFYQYQEWYEDQDGNEQTMIGDYDVIMGNPKRADGIRLYGAILDDAALMALSRYPSSWVQKNPSVRYTMTQSAPLPVLTDPDATQCITVR